MLPAHFYDVTDDKILVKKAWPHLKHFFMCSAPKNSYLSRRTYSDTSAKLVEARVGQTSFEHVQNWHYNSWATCKCIRAAKEPSTKHKSKLRVILIQIRVKHDVTRSLSKFQTIQIFFLHCDQINRHQHREIVKSQKNSWKLQLFWTCSTLLSDQQNLVDQL